MGAARYPLVQGAAGQLPFASGSFDVVFCDHGGPRDEFVRSPQSVSAAAAKAST
jgi:hypothetical protein